MLCCNELNFPLNPGPLSFGLGPNHIVLGLQLAPGEIRLVCIPDVVKKSHQKIYFLMIDTAFKNSGRHLSHFSIIVSMYFMILCMLFRLNMVFNHMTVSGCDRGISARF